MAATTLSVKNAAAATVTLSGVEDGGNSNAFVGKTQIADASGTNAAAVDSSGRLSVTDIQVSGTKAAGTAATKSVLTGAVYNSALPALSDGQQAALQSTTAGRLLVTDDLVTGTKAAGTAATNSALVGAVYNSALPSPSNGQQVALQVDATSRLIVAPDLVTGTKAAGTAASNSLLAGAVYNSSLPSLTNGQQAAVQADSSGRLIVAAQQTEGTVAAGTAATKATCVGGVYVAAGLTLTNGQGSALAVDAAGKAIISNVTAAAAAADGASNPTAGIAQGAGLLFNGSTWDRKRGNREVTLVASAARTATESFSDVVCYNAIGAVIVIDITAITDTPSVVFTVEGKCTLSGKYYTLLASAAKTGTGTTALFIGPGVPTGANVSIGYPLPRIIRITATHADADSMTYSVSCNFMAS
jgi:hypothetical protein